MQDSPLKQLLILLLTIICSFVTISLLSAIVGIAFFGLEAATDPSSLINNVNYLRFFQLSQSIGLFVIPPLAFAWYYHLQKKEYFQLQYKPRIKIFVLASFVILISQPLISYLGYINQNMQLPAFLSGLENWMRIQEDLAANMTELILSDNSSAAFLVNALIIAIVPAVGEELLFRGTLQPIFIKIFKNTHWGIWFTAILFSAIHMQFLGFLPRMVLGALFGYTVVYGKSLWLGILCHFINNFSALVLYTQYQNNSIDENPLKGIGESPNIIWVIISFALSILAIIYMKRVTPMNKPN